MRPPLEFADANVGRRPSGRIRTRQKTRDKRRQLKTGDQTLRGQSSVVLGLIDDLAARVGSYYAELEVAGFSESALKRVHGNLVRAIELVIAVSETTAPGSTEL